MKRLLSLFIVLFGLINFGYCDLLGGFGSHDIGISGVYNYSVPDGQFVCIRTQSNGCTMSPGQPNGDNTVYGYALYCFDGDFTVTCPGNTISYFEGFVYPKMSSNDCQSEYNLVPNSQLLSCQSDLATATGNLATCHFDLNSCQSDLNTCQNSSSCDYSGYILENEITPGYCETRFDLISPSDCPNSSGSGDIQRSSFRVNNFQVMGGKNIYLYIPEWLNRDYTYVDENLQIEVENEGDEEYIQGIIDINSYRPSSEDFTNIFVSGLTLIMPYIVVALFIIFVWKLIKKIFR